jgi:hypothetical protein
VFFFHSETKGGDGWGGGGVNKAHSNNILSLVLDTGTILVAQIKDIKKFLIQFLKLFLC